MPPGNIQINAEAASSRWQRDRHDQKVVEFPRTMPQKFGKACSPAGSPACHEKKPQLRSGHIEESNVNSLSEMVKMIQGMRSYESAQKLISDAGPYDGYGHPGSRPGAIGGVV